jgi:uncharacterized protein
MNKALVSAITRLIWLYQAMFSGFLGSRCRFYPSCSQYAIEAVEVHGPLAGGLLAAKRLCKCHPYHAGGIDEVPGLPRQELGQQRPGNLPEVNPEVTPECPVEHA